MKTPARVTQRCLREDLTDGWDDAADQRLAQQGQAGIQKAVHLLGHKLIQKAVDDFPVNPHVKKKRESISGLTNPAFWKVKVDRWRGAAFEDKDGQVWLVAAGHRYAGERKDFYKRFMTDVAKKGAEFFLPSERDLALYRDELSLLRLEERERHVQELAVGLLRLALKSAEHYAEGTLSLRWWSEDPATLAHVSLMVELPGPDEHDTPYELLIEISEMDWSYQDVLAWDEQVLLAALCPQEDRWGTTHTADRLHSLSIPTGAELEAMAQGDVASDPPGHFLPGSTSHTVHRARLTECTVEGEPVQGVCGRWFVPRQDHADRLQCPTCRDFAETLGLRVGSEDGPAPTRS